MGIFEHDHDTVRPAHGSAGPTEAVAEPASDVPGPAFAEPLVLDPAVVDETIFSVLAGRARSRPLSHLWITAIVGGVDAIALGIARPGLWWIAAGCAAVSGYATWGIADRALERLDSTARNGLKGTALRVVRILAVACGIIGAVATVVGFLGASVGKTGPPG